MSIFKAYDIRGTYPDQIDEALARKIGAAIAHHMQARCLAVGRDMRNDGPVGAGCVDRGHQRPGM